jgi:hypothetical protein
VASSISIHHGTVLARSPGLLGATLGSEIVTMSVLSGRYFGLNDTARRIWELLESPRRSDDIIGTLDAEFDIDRATLERDTLAFLDRLCTEGLVQIVATDT